ncbi:hypothetical protein [Nonomuraea sp. PA05]|uniref:hypothetical protein n=1 Tax=Nonomuraea sp. PA05 TaxID=2604466 RepID=UPI0016522EDB|nr:hypothetical protein [Nonomuraea sp. PA05]
MDLALHTLVSGVMYRRETRGPGPPTADRFERLKEALRLVAEHVVPEITAW